MVDNSNIAKGQEENAECAFYATKTFIAAIARPNFSLGSHTRLDFFLSSLLPDVISN